MRASLEGHLGREVAAGLAPIDKVFVVDTERGSASLYADKGGFKVCELTDDFSPGQSYLRHRSCEFCMSVRFLCIRELPTCLMPLGGPQSSSILFWWVHWVRQGRRS